MKKLLFAFLLLPLFGNAQTVIHDSMVMNPNYANQVFYSMANGIVSTAPVNNWHIAIVPNIYDAGIWANEAEGVTVYLDTNTSNFSKVDTTGMATKWPVLYNPDTSWSYGAFNIPSKSTFDYGWGYYDYTGTHNVVGNRIFVLKIVDRSGNITFRKIKFELREETKTGKLNMGDFVFHYASLDSTVDKRDTLRYAKWKNKLLAYYDLIGDSFVNREPNIQNWDLTMTRYITNIGIEYPVTGILQNYYTNVFHVDTTNVQVVQETKVDLKTVKTPAKSAFNQRAINGIGYQFAFFDMKSFKYVLIDSMCYFVRTTNGNIYKIVVTYFVGQTDGKVKFDKTLVFNASETQNLNQKNSGKCSIIGNPVTSNNLELLTDYSGVTENSTINLIDMNGRLLHSYPVGTLTSGIHAFNLDVSPYANGLYLIELKAASGLTIGNVKTIIAR